MEKLKSVVAANDPKDALEIFRQKLLPFIMEKSKEIEVSYFRPKDILSVHILPKRTAKTGGGEEDFLIRYDWDDPESVVGFEVLDFSLIIPKIYNRAIVPDLPMKFSIKGTEVNDLSLQEVLEWAYLAFVLRKEEVPMVV